MNPFDSPLPNFDPQDPGEQALDPQVLDRLVDGEMPEAERRRVLSRLDRVPDGWRACALAFLESQCWREGMRGLAAASGAAAKPAVRPAAAAERAPPEPPAVKVPWRRVVLQWPRRYGGTLLAMAASFLLAMAVVGHLREGGRADRAPGPRENAVAKLASPSHTPSSQTEPPDAAIAALGPSDRDAGSPGWRLVTLGVPGEAGGRGRSIDLPALEADQLDESLLKPGPQGMPNELRDALHRLGYEVRQQRQLLPMPLRDGRRLVVPVDRVEFHPVGNRAFQ
jgi:hypothetical protein